MQWIISVVGLVILFILAWSVRRLPMVSYRDASLEDELLPHLAALSARAEGRGRSRIHMPRHMLRTLEKTVGFLNRLPTAELLPAAQWLSDNGRFLQEETAALKLALHSAPKLCKASTGGARISMFARELLGHTTADLRAPRLLSALEAWQSVSPFSVDETNGLPLALRAALLHIVCEMAELCVHEQKFQLAAEHMARLLRHKRENAALRLFKRHEHSPVFLEHLLTELRAYEDKNGAVWLDRYFNEHELSVEKLAKSEHEHQTEACLWVSNAITSLRTVGRMPWYRMLEDISPIHAALLADSIYSKMDLESRAYYRGRVAALSRMSKKPELSVCAAANTLCQSAEIDDVRAHVGYYLLDDGISILLHYLQAMHFVNRLRRFASTHACGLFRTGAWLVFLLLLLLAVALRVFPVFWLAFAVVFLHAAEQLALWILRRTLHPRLVPRMQVERLSDGIQTLVVCPTLLMTPEHALGMVKHLSVLYRANPDPKLHFLLLGDFQDSLTGSLSSDNEIITTAASAIRALCADTGHTFLYMQRERVFHVHDHLFMSRERKRGSLETLLNLVVGRPVSEGFAYCSVPPESFRERYRYVITLDSDTILPPGSALRMVGAMLHPLQRRHESHGEMRGVSIIQPRMEIAAHTIGSKLSLLLGGRGGTDPYNALIADFFEDGCNRGSFVGKGIIDPVGFLNATEGKMLEGSILSHDLLEGELAGCESASDMMLFDGHPLHLKGFCYRLHRWTRGDWQLLPYVLPIFPMNSRAPSGILDATAKHKIWQNLFRSMVDPLRLLLLGYAVVAHRPWIFWLALLLCELPALIQPSVHAFFSLLCRLAALPCFAAMQADAIVRTLFRLFFSRRYLLQWTTAAQLSKPAEKPVMLFFYLSILSGAVMIALSLIPRALVFSGILLGAAWILFPFVLPFLEQAYQKPSRVTDYMREVLERLAKNTLLFFETAITEEDHALPPDNVQIEPNKGISHRTSPTNMGLYLTSLIASEHMHILSTEEMAERIDAALQALEKLPKWEGQFYNWYDTRTLLPMNPPFISSVDSGNFAVCLLTCAQGLRALMNELPARYRGLAARLDALVNNMRFAPLFDPDAELFYIGLSPDEASNGHGHYDLLASEARLLSFVSIMLGQIPVRHWYRLGRARAHTAHGQTLLSYSGTMFEYMMPLLFQPLTRGTLLYNACRGAFREQCAVTYSGVFGVSESGYYAFDPNLFYQYKAFGIASLALDSGKNQNVIAPYASMLCLSLHPKHAFANLLKLQNLGMEGPLGLFEAADFAPERIGEKQAFKAVRSHMAHHQGMILCAICNALCDQYMVKLFSELPKAQAYRLLLEEKPLHGRGIIKHPLKRNAKEPAQSPLHFSRIAQPLHFPMDAHLLHGAGTTLLIDAQGGGYASRNGIMMTRFLESCRFPSGLRLYLRDSQSGSYWSVTDPTLTRSVSFESAQAVFTNERFHTEATLRIFINPLDGTVLHHLTLQNTSASEHMMEVCSYLEPSLASQRDDSAHPTFQNLFIHTERLEKYGVCATRKPRHENEPQRSLWHMLSTNASLNMLRIQTDRTAFLGRGRTVYAPHALDLPITTTADTLGAMIEPCLSLRGQFVLPASGCVQFVFATLLPSEQDTRAAFAQRYAQPDSALRCYEPALTQELVTARYLGLTPTMQTAISRLCGSLCYTEQPMQAQYAVQNTLPLRELWGLGLSGDLPLLLVECESDKDLSLVKLLLKAHAAYRMCGLWVDLIVLCMQPSGYEHPLRDALSELAQTSHSHELIGKEGGIHLLDRDGLSAELYGLLKAAARIVLLGEHGSLSEQLKRLTTSVKARPLYACKPSAAWKAALPAIDELLLDNGYGGFGKADGSYVITLPPGRQTPAPWSNPLCSRELGTLACESGLVFSYVGNSHSGRLTRWPNDTITPRGDENFFLRDSEHKLIWSVTRYPLGYGLPARITHAPGETAYEISGYGISCRLQCFTDEEAPLCVRVLHLKNEDTLDRELTYFHTCAFTLGASPASAQLTVTHHMDGVVYVENPELEGTACLCGVDPEATLITAMSAGEFDGLWSVAPVALVSGDALPCDAGNVAVLAFTVLLKAGETKTITSAIGFGQTREALAHALEMLRTDGASLHLHQVKQLWEQRLGGLHFDLPDTALALMLNRWLPYQVIAARLMMRAGFYQAGGAYGFRDQLQDMLSQVHTAPQAVREHLLLCAAHQFEEGDVQHWWHPARYGVRTRISDDLLFLPFVAAVYIQVSGDTSLLSEVVPYLHDAPLAPEEHERLSTPEISSVSEPFWQHCVRAIDHVSYGTHGLPLMGGGDWNDGMNRVGGENGESVWLGMFLCETLRRFSALCEPVTARRFLDKRLVVLQMLDRFAWDGAWYLRAWYDSGDKLGSISSSECRLDVLSQSWGVLAGVSRERCTMAMDHVWRMLYEPDIGILKLFTPPFRGVEKPGYIASYLPGIRENGGQYTHAVPWAISAFHQLGQDDRAWELVTAMLPLTHAANKQLSNRYRVEPYVLAADIYSNPQQRGRGGWTWYTGSASWFLYVMLEQLFGFQKQGNTLRFRPVAPASWDAFRITYHFGTATYHLHARRDCPFPVADGEQLRDGRLLLLDDGKIHEATFPLRG
ncbi:MAG: hypothetical protein RR431_04830 [Clostridia bacterium]